MSKRLYECMIIFTSNLEEVKREEIIKKLSKMASTDTRVEKLGMRRFSVPINYRAEGFYILLHFAGDAEVVAKMTAIMNITDGIERFLFVTKDEKQIAYDAERKAKRAAARRDMEMRESSPISERDIKTAKGE